MPLAAPRVLAGLLLCLPTLLPAQDRRWEAELEKIQKEYALHYQQAIEPVKRRHADALGALVRKATQTGDLETALRARKELEKLGSGTPGTGPAAPPVAPGGFVGQWEYEEGGRTYRRIIRADGTVELWRNGKNWRNEDGKPWWEGFKWRLAGNKLEIQKPGGEAVASWERLGPDRLRQTNAEGKSASELVLAKEEWK